MSIGNVNNARLMRGYILLKSVKGNGFLPSPHSIVNDGLLNSSINQSVNPPYFAVPEGREILYPVNLDIVLARGSEFSQDFSPLV